MHCRGQKLLFSPWISGFEAQKSSQAKPSPWGRLGVRTDCPLTICAQEEKTAAMMMRQLTGCWAAQLVSCQKEKCCLWQPAKEQHTRVVARGKGHRGDCNDTMNNSFFNLQSQFFLLFIYQVTTLPLAPNNYHRKTFMEWCKTPWSKPWEF